MPRAWASGCATTAETDGFTIVAEVRGRGLMVGAAHLQCPTLLSAAAAELAIGATNQSMDSFGRPPAATLFEEHLVRWLASTLGLAGGPACRRAAAPRRTCSG